MKKVLIAIGILVAVFAVIIMVFTGIYNRLIAGEEQVNSAWAQVENVYQRRLDLIPNLVEIVKGYMTHERGTLMDVINARAKISQINLSSNITDDPKMLEQFQNAQDSLSSALSKLLVVVERYPDLKANQNFLALQSQIEGTENRIAVERKRYNDSAREFNVLRRTIPNVFVANLMGLQNKAYFKADEGASKAPVVKF